MKLTPVILLALSTAIARADLVMVQEMDMAGAKSKLIMSIKGKMVRTDNGDLNSVIMNTDTGDMTSLMHEQKMAMTLDGAALKAAQAQTPQGEKPVIPQPVATGQKEKVGGHECEIYTLKNGETEVKMWIAKDYPGYDKLKGELAALKKMGGAATADQPDLPGMAIKTETKAGGLTYVTTLISLKETPVDEKIFTPPADYKAPGA